MAYNSKPLEKLREKYQKKIDIIIAEFGKEVDAEIKKQHNKKANQKDLICFEMGFASITKYKSKKQYLASRLNYTEENHRDFEMEISTIGYNDCFETGYGINPVMPIFDGEQMPNFLE